MTVGVLRVGYSSVFIKQEGANENFLGERNMIFYNRPYSVDICNGFLIKRISLTNALLKIEIISNKASKLVYQKESIYLKLKNDSYQHGLSIILNNIDYIFNSNINIWKSTIYCDYKIESECWYLDNTKKYFIDVEGEYDLQGFSALTSEFSVPPILI